MRVIIKNPFLLLGFIPAFAFAHGEEILFSFFAIAIVMIFMIVAIKKTNWNRKGKVLLLTTYLASIVITQLYFYDWPALQYQTIITACTILIPFIVVSVNYFLFDKYFKIKK